MALRIIISQGLTKLHMPEVAKYLKEAGFKIKFLTGWLPKKGSSAVINFLGRLMGKDKLYQRLSTRKPTELNSDEIISLSLPEFYYGFLKLLIKLKIYSEDDANNRGWKCWGKYSKRHITGADIFHVRSGAGGEGAIEKAQAEGMIVVADHSIAHPVEMKKALLGQYEKFNLDFDLDPDNKFWSLITDDCRRANFILVNSDYVAESFTKNNFSPEKIKTIYWGVREDFIGLKQSWKIGNKINLVFTGTFSIRKGAHTLIEIAEVLDKEGIEFTLHIVGPIEFDYSKYYTLSKNIKFHGNLLQDNLKEILINGDIYLFPTFAEGCARSAMEAMAIGLPVITTPNCGVPITSYNSGILVEPGNVKDFVSEIKKIGLNENLRTYIGKNATELIRSKYTWADYKQNMLALYNEIKLSMV